MDASKAIPAVVIVGLVLTIAQWAGCTTKPSATVPAATTEVAAAEAKAPPDDSPVDHLTKKIGGAASSFLGIEPKKTVEQLLTEEKAALEAEVEKLRKENNRLKPFELKAVELEKKLVEMPSPDEEMKSLQAELKRLTDEVALLSMPGVIPVPEEQLDLLIEWAKEAKERLSQAHGLAGDSISRNLRQNEFVYNYGKFTMWGEKAMQKLDDIVERANALKPPKEE